MSRPTHTPGPWRRPPFQGNPGPSSQCDGLTMHIHAGEGRDCKEVAHVTTWGGDDWQECERNANLIAAAPDMFETLEALIPSLDQLPSRVAEMVTKSIRAARGES